MKDTPKIEKSDETKPDLKREEVNIYVERSEVKFHKFEDSSSPTKSEARQRNDIRVCNSKFGAPATESQNERVNSQATRKQIGEFIYPELSTY